MAAWMVGVDTGGTFTDLIAVERETRALRLAKVPSVPGDPSDAVRQALEQLFAGGVAPGEVTLFVHGTTVATNALLEGQGRHAAFSSRGAFAPSMRRAAGPSPAAAICSTRSTASRRCWCRSS